jgi:hypothetical protein
MSEKFGLFEGGDPREFRQDASICTEEQISNWRYDCARWNSASASGQILPREPSQEIYRETTAADYAAALYGGGVFDFEAPSESSPEPTELGEAEFEEIMKAPLQNARRKFMLPCKYFHSSPS